MWVGGEELILVFRGRYFPIEAINNKKSEIFRGDRLSLRSLAVHYKIETVT